MVIAFLLILCRCIKVSGWCWCIHVCSQATNNWYIYTKADIRKTTRARPYILLADFKLQSYLSEHWTKFLNVDIWKWIFLKNGLYVYCTFNFHIDTKINNNLHTVYKQSSQYSPTKLWASWHLLTIVRQNWTFTFFVLRFLCGVFCSTIFLWCLVTVVSLLYDSHATVVRWIYSRGYQKYLFKSNNITTLARLSYDCHRTVARLSHEYYVSQYCKYVVH